MIESLNTHNSKLWIGGYKNSAGQWCWVTGEPWEYQNWGDGEPNNSSNVVADESCVAVWPVKANDLQTAIHMNRAATFVNGSIDGARINTG